MREIIKYPDIRLLQKSREINLNMDKTLLYSLVEDMKFYLNKSPGLAAVQLGENIRFIGVKFGMENLFIINPEIIKNSEDIIASNEGCLSLDSSLVITVPRYRRVKVRGTTLDGRSISWKGRDLFGRVLQHEIDHLDGVLINVKMEKY